MYPDYLKYLLHQTFSAFLEILKRHLGKNKYKSFYYIAENKLLDTLKSIAKIAFLFFFKEQFHFKNSRK